MKINKKLLSIIFAAVIGNIIIYPFIPENIPHRNFQMEIDGYTGKWTMLLLPLTTVGMYFLLYFLGKLDKRNEMNKNTYELITILTVMFFIVLNIWIIFSSLGYEFDIIKIINLAMGVFYIVIGNYFPRVKMNSVFGVRIIWTLRNAEVWKKTHRFGGYVFIGGGFFCLAAAFLNGFAGIIALLAVTLAITIIICVYSYVTFIKIKDSV